MPLISPNKDLHPKEDHLHHFGIPNEEIGYDYFADVKFILCAGSSNRIAAMAESAFYELHLILPNAPKPMNLSRTPRFVLFKLGPIIFVSHGMGNSSLSIMLNEVIKMLYYAKCSDVVLIRCGTCGGIGAKPGALIISTDGLNGELKPEFTQFVLGKQVKSPTRFDDELVDDLYKTASSLDLEVTKGKTLAADGFYEEQARKNGLFCTYSQQEADAFIAQVYELGVRNMEMEATCLASMCLRAGVKAAIVCVALVNRLETDVVHPSESELKLWESLPGKVVIEYIKKRL